MQRVSATYLAVSLLAVACSVYDETKIRSADNAVKQHDAGLNAPSSLIEAGPAVEGGSDLPPDFTRRPDAAAETRCGDGHVSGVEKCDIAIAAGTPGACPTECPSIEKCVKRVLNGTACQADCVVTDLLCQGGDGCCSGNCTRENDSDCSQTCGDGMVQPNRGETCENTSATPCKKSDAECDDGDACTVDKLTGNAAACNVDCMHTAVTDLKAGDGCCPKGANANTDTDCKPMCGNKIKEGTEECDGAMGCGADCKLTLLPDQMRCLESAGTDKCKQCACKQCTATELACWSTMDTGANKRCADMLVCSREKNCLDTTCYCGTTTDILVCALGPTGPCRAQVETTAGTNDPLMINSLKTNTASPLGRAAAADNCRIMQCNDVCR